MPPSVASYCSTTASRSSAVSNTDRSVSAVMPMNSSNVTVARNDGSPSQAAVHPDESLGRHDL